MKIESQAALEELFEPFGDAGEAIVLRDRFSRYWIIDSSEHGDYFATSFAWEDDEVKLPARHDLAPIGYPATLVVSLPGTEFPEWSFDHDPTGMGVRYVVTNDMLAETMHAATPPGTKLLTRISTAWNVVDGG